MNVVPTRPTAGAVLGLWVFAHVVVSGALALISALAMVIGGGLMVRGDFLLALIQPALILPPLSLLQWMILQHWRPIPGRRWLAAVTLGGLLGASLALSAHVVRIDLIAWSPEWPGRLAAGACAGMGLIQSALLGRGGRLDWPWLAASSLAAGLAWFAAPLLRPLEALAFPLPILAGWAGAIALWALLTGIRRQESEVRSQEQ
ncbi:MAG TPA: hypothetical protein VD886_05640 [Herpetosiphonaceae bacterium]|nr:hypothetical protein [Herpetosiphonaceae bacterium]